MRKLVFLLLLSLSLSSTAFGQNMSDTQVLQYVASQKQAGKSEADIASGLLKRGVTLEQIQRLRAQYASQISKAGMDYTVDSAINDAFNRMRTNNEDDSSSTGIVSDSGSERDNNHLPAKGKSVVSTVPEALSPSGKPVFGRDIFNNQALTFEPQMNIATPQNYVLGPGDQVIVDIYGDTQKSQKLTVSPDGDVTVPGYGPISVSGLSVSGAQNRISSKLGSYYSSSQIKVTVGQTRSIMVNVMGEVRAPGTYTVSAFSTVFHALYRAGGISELGTLRNIKVFRQGRQISSVDVYEFILNGRLAGNVHLQDNDVIQVGPYESIVDISGHVKRPMAYEMRKGENLSALLRYCGGFTGDAYKKLIRVQRNSDDLKSVFNVEEFDYPVFKVNDGDVVSVDGIVDRYKNMVELSGAVFRPGMYQLGDKVFSVKSLLERADGMLPEAQTDRAILRRMKPNRTQEVITVNLEGIMSGMEPDMPLQNEDILYISTIPEHKYRRTLTILGEVVFPGDYDYADSITLENFIVQAGGLTFAASTAKVDVSRIYHDPGATTAGLDLKETFTFTLDENLNIVNDKNFVLQPFDIVQIRRSPTFQDPITVTIDGEVMFRGTYTMERKNMRLTDLVEKAGGFVDGAYVRGARLMRKMNDDEKARIRSVIRMARQTSKDAGDSISLNKLALYTTYPVGIHLDEAMEAPNSTKNIELMDGDVLTVPRFNHTVRISGDVHTPNTVAFEDGKDWKFYVDQAGGFGDRARKKESYIVYQNGTMSLARKGKIEPGCEVIVPTKAKRDPATINQWLGIGTSMASIGTMFATIANLIKK